MNKKLLSVSEAAEILGVSTKTVYREIARGKLTKIKVRCSSKISAEQLNAYIEQSTEGVAA